MPPTTSSSIQVTDDKPCYALSGNVEIFVNSERGGQGHGSSRVKLKNIVDYKWEVKKYHGRLIAVHRDGQVIAYSIKLKTGGGVRVVWNGERALIKGMSNEVLDLQFAHMSSKVVLACVDEASLHVYRVDTSPGQLDTHLLLKVDNPVDDVPLCSHRLSWCPFVPSTTPTAQPQPQSSTTSATTAGQQDEEADGAEEDYANHLLVWSQGPTFQALNVHLVVEAHGAGTYDYAELSEGVVQHQESKATITVATFSPDGTTMAVGFDDGNVYFYQMYLYSKETAPRRLYHWRPHEDRPVTALAFLDDHTLLRSTENGSFWKHALTATDNNTEIKLWRCDDWSCIQRICFKPTAFEKQLDFKLDIDASSSYLVLSEQKNRVLYTLQIGKQQQQQGTDAASPAAAASTVTFKSVAEFPLGSSILSFNIAGATKGKYQCGRLEDDDLDDEYDEDQEADPMFGVMIQMFLVQPKSVQECQVFFQTESGDSLAVESNKLNLTSGAEDMVLTPDIKAPDAPQSLFMGGNVPSPVSGGGAAPRQKSSAQINLMTPESFQSPATTQQQQSPADQNVSNSVLTTIRMLAASASSAVVSAVTGSAGVAGDPVAVAANPESMLSYAALEEQNKNLRKSLAVAVAEQPSNVDATLTPIASSTVNGGEILPSGNSSPSREVQEILSLKDEMFENHLQSSDLDMELEANSSGGNGTEVDGDEDSDEVDDDDEEEEEVDEDEETVSGNALAAKTKKAMEGIDAIKLYVDDDEEDNNNHEAKPTDSTMEWPKVPNILPDMARIAAAAGGGGGGTILVPENCSLNNLNGSANNTSSALEAKLDQVLALLSRNSDQINALERRLHTWEQQQQQQSLHNSSSSSIEVVQLPGTAPALTQEKLNKSLESHLMRCEEVIKYKLNDLQEKQATQLNLVRDHMSHTLKVVRQDFVENLASSLHKQLMVLVAREMESIKGMIQYEVANKLASSDKLLRENLAHVCSNKSLMESFASAIRSGVQHTVQVTFMEQINKLIIPAYEKATREMFKQTNDMFQKGVNNYSKQVHSYMTQFQPVHDQQEKLAVSMRALPEQFKVTNEKVMNSFSAQIIHEVNKDFKTLQLNVLKLIKESVKQEVSKGFESQAASLEDSVLSAVRSQAQTPSVFDIKGQIRHLLDQGQTNKAFHQALIANDLVLVEFTLETADIKDVFNPCTLEQTVLLSLVQQLSADMTAYTGTRHQYLSEAITSLNMSDTVIREHAPKILKQLSKNLHQYTEEHPNGQFGSRIRMLLMMIRGISMHFTS